MMTDPIADMLTRIRNAAAVKKQEVLVPHSKLKQQLAEVLAKEGFLGKIKVDEKDVKKVMSISLKYLDNQSVITSLSRVSTPGRKVYKGYKDLPRVKNDMGCVVISTSQGLMTNKEARRQKKGGEIICEIY